MKDIKIIAEDSDLLCIYKPSNLHTVNLPKKAGDSIASFLLKINPNFANISDKPEDAGIINRLDFETAGLVLVAKNQNTYKKLLDLSKLGEIKKYYYCLCDGDFKQTGELALWIGQSSHRSASVRVFKELPKTKFRARLASTNIISSKYSLKLNQSLVEVSLTQGCRHQIRASLAHLDHPLSGDSLYGSLNKKTSTFFLYAYKIEILKLKISFQINLPSSITENFT